MYNVKFVRDRKPRKLVFKADRKMKVYEGTGINYKRIRFVFTNMRRIKHE